MKKTLLALLLALGVAYGFVKNSVDKHIIEKRTASDTRYILGPDLNRFIAIGFKPALGDFYWIEGINYFGSEMGRGKKASFQYLANYADNIIALDPLFEKFYEWGVSAFIYNSTPVTRQDVARSIQYGNDGIRNLAEYGRSNTALIKKQAFNYAFEAKKIDLSLDYFRLGARAGGDLDSLVVGAAYALLDGQAQVANELKYEYLAEQSLVARKREDLFYAYRLLSSPAFSSQSAQFARTLRLELENDEEIKNMVGQRLNESPMMNQLIMGQRYNLPPSLKLAKILNINFEQNWMPKEMRLLLLLGPQLSGA